MSEPAMPHNGVSLRGRDSGRVLDSPPRHRVQINTWLANLNRAGVVAVTARHAIMRYPPASAADQLQMPPDRQGQTWIRVSDACASSGLPWRCASLVRAAPRGFFTPGCAGSGSGDMDARERTSVSARDCAGGDVGIGSGLDRNWRELRRRPKRLRRQHRLRKIEAEEVAGPVLVRDRRAAPRQQRRANRGG